MLAVDTTDALQCGTNDDLLYSLFISRLCHSVSFYLAQSYLEPNDLFYKGNILISTRNQLQPASASAPTQYQELLKTSRMHTTNLLKKIKMKA